MLILSMFFGLIILGYHAHKEYSLQHIHVYYQSVSATLDIKTCKILEGQLPAKQVRLAAAWVDIHKEIVGRLSSLSKWKKTFPY